MKALVGFNLQPHWPALLWDVVEVWGIHVYVQITTTGWNEKMLLHWKDQFKKEHLK